MALNILQLVSGEGKAGSTRSVIFLIGGLRKRGHKVIVAASPGSYNYQLLTEQGFNPVEIEMKSRYDIKSIRKIINLCGQERIDVINANLSTDRYLAIWAKFLGAKARIILTRRAMSRTSPLISFLYQFGADRIVAVSKAVKDSLCTQGIPSQIVEVIHNGIDIEPFEHISPQQIEELRGQYGISLYDKVIGMVARYDRIKGHTVLLKALTCLKTEYKVLLVGVSYEDKELCQEIEALNLKDRVILCGFQKEIAPLYRLMTISILPSFTEGLPLTILESMAAGVPVIGSNIQSISEIIEPNKNGLLFETGNPKDLATKISCLLMDERLLAELGTKGRETVKERFSIENTIIATEQMYCKVISE